MTLRLSWTVLDPFFSFGSALQVGWWIAGLGKLPRAIRYLPIDKPTGVKSGTSREAAGKITNDVITEARRSLSG